MAKRFISTELFDDDWFMDLSVSGKLLWIYFITKCDHAGIISFNEKLCRFQTGINDVQQRLKELESRVIKISDYQYFIPKFIFYQYPDFPNSKVNQQRGAIKILEKLGLVIDNKLVDLTTFKGVQRVLNPYVYGNGYDNGNGKEGESEGKPEKPKKEIPTYDEFLEYFKSLKEVYKFDLEFALKAKYDTWVSDGWKDGNKNEIKNWKLKLNTVIPYLKPMQQKQPNRIPSNDQY